MCGLFFDFCGFFSQDRYELRSDGSRDGFVTYTLSKVSDPMALFLAGENSVPVK